MIYYAVLCISMQCYAVKYNNCILNYSLFKYLIIIIYIIIISDIYCLYLTYYLLTYLITYVYGCINVIIIPNSSGVLFRLDILIKY